MKIKDLIKTLQELDQEKDIILDFEDEYGSTLDYYKLSDYDIADIDYEGFEDAKEVLSIRLQKI